MCKFDDLLHLLELSVKMHGDSPLHFSDLILLMKHAQNMGDSIIGDMIHPENTSVDLEEYPRKKD